MKTGNAILNNMLLGVVAAFSAWTLSGCILSSSGGSLPVSDDDSASFSFNIATTSHLSAGGDSIDVKKIRDNLHNKGNIDDTTIQITNFSVSFDDSTKAVVIANLTKKFVLQVWYKNPVSGDSLLALTTDTANALAFDSSHVAYELNKNLFGVLAGFHSLVSAIRDTTINSMHVSATINFVDLPVAAADGSHRLKADCYFTAQAAIKP